MTQDAFTGWVRPQPPVQKVEEITIADSPYTVSSLDQIIECDTSGGAITVNLPPAISNDGRSIIVVDLSGNAGVANITVDADGADLINGAANTVISTNYGAVTVVSDGTGWSIIATAPAASGAASGLTLLQTLTPSAAVSTTFAGLDGDIDKVYIIEGSLALSGGGPAMPFRLLPNNDAGVTYSATTGATWSTGGGPVGTSVIGAGNPWYPFAANVTAGARCNFWLRIDAARTEGAVNLIRTMTGEFTEFNPATGALTRVSVGAAYTTNASNLTSLVFDNAASATTYSGRISIYKLST